MKKYSWALAAAVYLCTSVNAQNYNAGPVHINGDIYDASAVNGSTLLTNSSIVISSGGVWTFANAKITTPRISTTQTEVVKFAGTSYYTRQAGYVDGYVRAETETADIMLPIGQSSYMPLMVKGAIAPGNSITAAWYDNKPLHSTHIAGVQYYFFPGYYDIQTASAGLDVIATVPHPPTDTSRLLGTADGVNFVDLGDGGINTVLPAGNYQLRFAKSSTTLPVTLMAFTASRQGNGSQLQWKISTEQSMKEYTVERSSDNRHYGVVGSLPSLGSTAQERTYSLYDALPLTGANYYRLRMTETNGNVRYSAVRLLNFDRVVRLSVYPNPVHDRAVVSGLEAGMQVTVVSLQGQQLLQQKAAGGTMDLPMANLPAAVYQLQVQDESGKLIGSYRFVKE